MKLFLLLLIGSIFSTNLFGHGYGTGPSCNLEGLSGHWTVFYPDGVPLSGQIEEDAKLHIAIGKIKPFSAILEGSVWEVADRIEGKCIDEVPTLAIEIKTSSANATETKWLCVDRVYSILGLMKRKDQKEPKLRQLGTRIMGTKEFCLQDGPSSSAVLTPGHAHADD